MFMPELVAAWQADLRALAPISAGRLQLEAPHRRRLWSLPRPFWFALVQGRPAEAW